MRKIFLTAKEKFSRGNKILNAKEKFSQQKKTFDNKTKYIKIVAEEKVKNNRDSKIIYTVLLL